MYHLEVYTNSSCKVYMSGQLMTPDKSESPTIFGDAGSYVTVPSDDTYIFSGLTKEPELKIMCGEEEIPYEIDAENKVTTSSSVQHFDTLQAAGCDFDILEFAEVWSKFMTDDLKGSRHGFNTVAAYLINGSTQYEDDLISADVHLLKHMHITRTGVNHEDVMDSTICLVKYGGEWKVINIRGIKK